MSDAHDGAEADEVFDHELTQVLQDRGDDLEELSQALLATGQGSIAGPGVMLRARLRAPRRWRRGSLHVDVEDAVSGQVTASFGSSLDRADSRDRDSISRKIAIDIALELAHGH